MVLFSQGGVELQFRPVSSNMRVDNYWPAFFNTVLMPVATMLHYDASKLFLSRFSADHESNSLKIPKFLL